MGTWRQPGVLDIKIIVLELRAIKHPQPKALSLSMGCCGFGEGSPGLTEEGDSYGLLKDGERSWGSGRPGEEGGVALDEGPDGET